MKKANFIKQILMRLLIISFFLVSGCAQSNSNDETQTKKIETAKAEEKDIADDKNEKIIVTFIELGSVRCIPCQKMVPIMESVEEKYGDQVEVVFYDVWTPEGKPFGDKYGIKAIPTQIFLDENREEFFRHEGFFPEEELVKVLKSQGVK